MTKKQRQKAVESLSHSLKGSLISGSMTPRTHTPAGRARLPVRPPKVTATRRAEKGLDSGFNGGEVSYADGIYLYLKLHKDLRPAKQHPMRVIMEPIFAATGIKPKHFVEGVSHDEQGWRIQCSSVEIAGETAKVPDFEVLGRKCSLGKYLTGGAQAFIATASGRDDYVLANKIALTTGLKN
ncbi:MAG: hypothetical protein M1835_001732 [Candelina submexicana]|nr:MAG: hypothetical protein M1835_001732 [Candelina submexicana]